MKIELSNDPTFTTGVVKVVDIANVGITNSTHKHIIADLTGADATGKISTTTQVTQSNVGTAYENVDDAENYSIVVYGQPMEGYRYVRITGQQEATGYLGASQISVYGNMKTLLQRKA